MAIWPQCRLGNLERAIIPRAEVAPGATYLSGLSHLLRLALASMGQPDTKVSDLCTELGITRQTLYRHVSPTGELRPDGEKLVSR
jgi:hypothetical protein